MNPVQKALSWAGFVNTAMQQGARVPPSVGVQATTALYPGQMPPRTTEIGNRTTPEQELELLYMRMEPDYRLRQTILEIRDMDKSDGRVKKIHGRTSSAAVKGGLRLQISSKATTIQRMWAEYSRRVELNNRQKIESDMRGLMMEGNLPIQWVIDSDSRSVARGVRMPAETLKPIVSHAGVFENPALAYEQWDWVRGVVIARFPLWQLNMVRLRPDNYDNFGCMGRPYLDASRQVWRQLIMTEKDLVVRRHTRAPQRYSHVLEGANKTELDAYEQKMQVKLGSIKTDFVSNRKGGVTALQGDANLDHIADVAHLLDTFFAGASAPKGLFGYVNGMARDILEDLKRDYYDELDALQDTAAFIYELGFRLELLLHNINPDADEFKVQYAERRTETPSQLADRALKLQTLGIPPEMVWETAGVDPVEVRDALDAQHARNDPYPLPGAIPAVAGPGGRPSVSITPGNARKGESATSVSQ